MDAFSLVRKILNRLAVTQARPSTWKPNSQYEHDEVLVLQSLIIAKERVALSEPPLLTSNTSLNPLKKSNSVWAPSTEVLHVSCFDDLRDRSYSRNSTLIVSFRQKSFVVPRSIESPQRDREDTCPEIDSGKSYRRLRVSWRIRRKRHFRFDEDARLVFDAFDRAQRMHVGVILVS